MFISFFQDPSSKASLQMAAALLKHLAKGSIWYIETDKKTGESAIVWDLTGCRYKRLSCYNQEPKSELTREYYGSYNPVIWNDYYSTVDFMLNDPVFKRLLSERFFAKYSASRDVLLGIEPISNGHYTREYRLVFPFGLDKPFVNREQVLEYLSGCLKLLDITVPIEAQLRVLVDSCERDKALLEAYASVIVSNEILFLLAVHIFKDDDAKALALMMPSFRETVARVIDKSSDIRVLEPKYLSKVILKDLFLPIRTDDIDEGSDKKAADRKAVIAPLPRHICSKY